MSRAYEINEKITWVNIKRVLKSPELTWSALLVASGLTLKHAYNVAKGTHREKPRPSFDDIRKTLNAYVPRNIVTRIREMTPSEKNWVDRKPKIPESELIRELQDRIKDELRQKGIIQ